MNRPKQTDDNPTILIAAGGTGGHVFPALAIAEAIVRQQAGATVIFVGTRNRMESRVVPEAGFELRCIWISGFHRRFTLKNLLFPVKLMVSLVQSLRLLLNINPDLVLSCGGYVAGPVGWVAALLNIPLALQEQNSYPGVTNRMLSKRATRIYTAFEAASRHFPADRVRQTGNPTRRDLTDVDRQEALSSFYFSPDYKTLLVMGGSGGARTINRAMTKHLDQLHDELGLQIIWICGSRYEQEILDKIEHEQYSRLRLYHFLDNIAEAYAAADLVVSRAGAGTCAELQLTGSPSILVPSPHVAGDHQRKNARAMVEEDAAIMIEDHRFDEEFISRVEELLADDERLRNMRTSAQQLARPDAADTIAADLFTLTNQKAKA